MVHWHWLLIDKKIDDLLEVCGVVSIEEKNSLEELANLIVRGG